jgi:ComF family protein
LIRDFLRLLYPEVCAGCNKALSITEKGVCISCWIEIKEYNNNSNSSFFGRFKVEKEIYAFEYLKNEVLQKVIHNIKYKGNKSAAFVLGIEIGKRVNLIVDNIDAIIPVPISNKKRQNRGYNQCDFIAKGVQSIINKPIIYNYITRTGGSQSQVSSDRFERWQKVKNQFLIQNKVKGIRHVLVVDDVVTSGATIHGCIEELNKNDLIITIAAIAKTT